MLNSRFPAVLAVASCCCLVACENPTQPEGPFDDPGPREELSDVVGAGGGPTQWSTVYVTTTKDQVDAAVGDGVCLTLEGACSIRAALQEANASPNAFRIVLEGKTYERTLPDMPPGDGQLGGDFHVESTVLIRGPTGNPAIIESDGTSHGIFTVHGSDVPSSAWFENLILQGAGTEEICCGAALRAVGNADDPSLLTVVVNRVEVRDNQMAAVRMSNVRYIQWDTTIHDNIGALWGGWAGALSIRDGTAVIRFSTIHNNTCLGPGGLGGSALGSSGNSEVKILQSTVSNNSCHGISLGRSGQLNNVTVFNNLGLGLFFAHTSGSHGVFNTIVANNVAGDCDPAAPPLFSVKARNVLLTDAVVCPELAGFVGVASVADMDLLPLADNGGPTRTHALGPSSPAIDAGDAGPWVDQGGFNHYCYSLDQRHMPRVGDCDLGAYERQGR